MEQKNSYEGIMDRVPKGVTFYAGLPKDSKDDENIESIKEAMMQAFGIKNFVIKPVNNPPFSDTNIVVIAGCYTMSNKYEVYKVCYPDGSYQTRARKLVK